MKTSLIPLLVVGMMVLAACADTSSPEPAIIPDSTNVIDANDTETAHAQLTSTVKPVATSTPEPPTPEPPVPESPTPEPPPTYTPTPTPNPRSYFDLGKENIANDDIDSAISNLSRAIELDPDNVDAYYLRGLLYTREEHYDEAIADFERVVELDSTHTDVMVARAMAYAARGAHYALERDHDRAITDFERSIELDPYNADARIGVAGAYLLRGIAYYEKGDHREAFADIEKAIANFENIIEIDPNNDEAKVAVAFAYFVRGIVQYEEGNNDRALADFDKALADFERVIELYPGTAGVNIAVAESYLVRGTFHSDEGDNHRALADFERAIELDPNNVEARIAVVDAYLLRGTAYSQEGEFDRAITDFDRAVELDPENTYVKSAAAYVYLQRGVGYAEEGDHDWAIADFDKAVKLDPDNTRVKNAGKFIKSALIPDELSAERIEWSLCEGILECGFVEVPADYRNPGAGSIRIAVNVRRADSRDERIGYLFVNPGGPGGSGLELVQDSDFAFAGELMTRFDIVGFDPRGVGASEPSFACGAPGEQLALLNSIDGEIDSPEETTSGEAAANLCIASMGSVGGLLHSEYVAKDMDEIRKALGAEQITYLGFSYGSELGVWYATLYPESVRAMVVDGADNPVDRADTQQDRVEEAFEEWLAFGELMEQALAACDSEECPIYNEGDPIGYYKSAVEKLHLVNSEAGGVPNAGFLAMLTPLYAEELWPILWESLYELRENDDPAILLEFAAIQLGDDLTVSNFTAHVNCLDGLVLYPELDRTTRFQDSDLIDAAITERLSLIDAIYPSYHSACPFYDQFAPSALEGPLDGSGVPILVIGNRTDPATSFGESEELVTETLSNGYLLETSHASHVVYPDNDCVNEYVHKVLIEAVYPDEGVYCEREN